MSVTTRTMLKKSDDCGHSFLNPDINGNAFILSLVMVIDIFMVLVLRSPVSVLSQYQQTSILLRAFISSGL